MPAAGGTISVSFPWVPSTANGIFVEVLDTSGAVTSSQSVAFTWPTTGQSSSQTVPVNAQVSVTVTLQPAAISISPGTPNVAPNGTLTFTAVGGTGTGYQWSLTVKPSGGTIDATTGVYTAGPIGNVTDIVGVVDSANHTAAVAVTVGATPTIAPAIASLLPNHGVTLGGNAVIITGSSFTGATVVAFGANPSPSFIVNSSTQITATVPAGAAGGVPVTVTTPSGTSNSVTYTYDAVPVITNLNPNSGPSTGGNQVVLTGTGFTGATAVRFGFVPASSFTVNSSTQITAIAPGGLPLIPVQVTVTTPAGTSAGLPYIYTLGPVLTSLSAASGPSAGGNTITLTGSGFAGATAVMFGSTPAASFTVVSDNQITAVAPAGAAGTVQVTVTASGTTNALPYQYLNAPQINSVNPSSGPNTGGTTVVLTGVGFAGTTSVTFGGTPVTSFTVDSDTQITVTTPAVIASVVDVIVTTPGGTATASGAYTYI